MSLSIEVQEWIGVGQISGRQGPHWVPLKKDPDKKFLAFNIGILRAGKNGRRASGAMDFYQATVNGAQAEWWGDEEKGRLRKGDLILFRARPLRRATATGGSTVLLVIDRIYCNLTIWATHMAVKGRLPGLKCKIVGEVGTALDDPEEPPVIYEDCESGYGADDAGGIF